MAIQLTITSPFNLVQTAFNEIAFNLSYYNTTTPTKKLDTLYVEIYTVPSRNILQSGTGKTGAKYLTRLIVDTDATGKATFLLNDSLTTVFNTYTQPGTIILQRDTDNYCGYFLKYGYVKFTATNEMQYKKIGETGVQWALRGVLQENEYLSVVDYTYPVDYLTHLPNGVEIHHNENTYLSFLLPQLANADTQSGILVKADFYYDDNTEELNQTVTEYVTGKGGIYLLNVKPELLSPARYKDLVEFSVWLEYGAIVDGAVIIDLQDTVYEATANYTATCPSGYYGQAVTSTVKAYSNISQADAQQQATAQAKENAEAALTCGILYTSTKTVTVSCPTGQYSTGGGTATGYGTSYDSQADADYQADQQARATANASLMCAVIGTTYTSTKSVTVSCPAGQNGTPVTKTATATSYASQADADAKALAQATSDATAALVCSTQQSVYTSTKSFTARCQAGYKGGAQTRTAYAESVISQQDADNKALGQAQQLALAGLTCYPISGIEDGPVVVN